MMFLLRYNAKEYVHQGKILQIYFFSVQDLTKPNENDGKDCLIIHGDFNLKFV